MRSIEEIAQEVAPKCFGYCDHRNRPRIEEFAIRLIAAVDAERGEEPIYQWRKKDDRSDVWTDTTKSWCVEKSHDSRYVVRTVFAHPAPREFNERTAAQIAAVKFIETMEKVQERLNSPVEQEPVAWWNGKANIAINWEKKDSFRDKWTKDCTTPLYTHPAPAVPVELAAAQAREARLREGLASLIAKFDSESYTTAGELDDWKDLLFATQQPTSDEALRKHVAAELRNLADNPPFMNRYVELLQRRADELEAGK